MSYILNLSDIKQWNQLNEGYYTDALIVFITLLPHSFINIYFLRFVLKNKYLKQHKFIQYTTIIFSCEYLLAGGNTMLLEGQYLFAYYTKTKIHFWSCFILRTLQQCTLFSISTTIFLFAVQRFFIIAYNIKIKWSILFFIFFIISSLSFINVYLAIFQSKYGQPDGICSFIPIHPMRYLLYLSTFLNTFFPFLALLTNLGTFYKLKKAYKQVKSVSKYKNYKRSLLNLSIQTFIPFLCNTPPSIFFFLQIFSKTYIPSIAWRLADVFHYIQYSTTTFITLLFIKEIKETIVSKFSLKISD